MSATRNRCCPSGKVVWLPLSNFAQSAPVLKSAPAVWGPTIDARPEDMPQPVQPQNVILDAIVREAVPLLSQCSRICSKNIYLGGLYVQYLSSISQYLSVFVILVVVRLSVLMQYLTVIACIRDYGRISAPSIYAVFSSI